MRHNRRQSTNEQNINTKPCKYFSFSVTKGNPSSLLIKYPLYFLNYTENFRHWCLITVLWLFCFCLFHDKGKISHLDTESSVLKTVQVKGTLEKSGQLFWKLKISKSPMSFKCYLIEHTFGICFLTWVCIVSQCKELYRCINYAMIPM